MRCPELKENSDLGQPMHANRSAKTLNYDDVCLPARIANPSWLEDLHPNTLALFQDPSRTLCEASGRRRTSLPIKPHESLTTVTSSGPVEP